MARRLRIQWPGAIYHVTARSCLGRFVFRDLTSRETFLFLLRRSVELCDWRCHSYCLMTTHFHLVIETPSPNLAVGMHRLNGVYAQFANRRYGERGHLFEGRYKSVLVETESHMLEVLRYVALNPVRAGLCAAPEDWRWSSYPDPAISG